MLDPRDPERWRDFMERAARHHAEFEAGRMSVHVYRAHLYSLGFRGREIEAEVGLHWPLPIIVPKSLPQRSAEQSLPSFVTGLPGQ